MSLPSRHRLLLRYVNERRGAAGGHGIQLEPAVESKSEHIVRHNNCEGSPGPALLHTHGQGKAQLSPTVRRTRTISRCPYGPGLLPAR